jgi:hypothetical protein
MHRILALLAACTVLASAHAGEVFVTKDAQGHPVYTDKPESLPAAKVNVATSQTDTVEVKKRYDAEMKSYAEADKAASEARKRAAESSKATAMTGEDKAKRCQDARTRYEAVMSAQRLYEEGDKADERRYLDSKEIDAARAQAKTLMDEFCSGQ